ncbi:MAG: hypothetical protein WC861_04225 [Candidatus Micrarchaeia archaeon]|jgi:hypothetical protein
MAEIMTQNRRNELGITGQVQERAKKEGVRSRCIISDKDFSRLLQIRDAMAEKAVEKPTPSGPRAEEKKAAEKPTPSWPVEYANEDYAAELVALGAARWTTSQAHYSKGGSHLGGGGRTLKVVGGGGDEYMAKGSKSTRWIPSSVHYEACEDMLSAKTPEEQVRLGREYVDLLKKDECPNKLSFLAGYNNEKMAVKIAPEVIEYAGREILPLLYKEMADLGNHGWEAVESGEAYVRAVVNAKGVPLEKKQELLGAMANAVPSTEYSPVPCLMLHKESIRLAKLVLGGLKLGVDFKSLMPEEWNIGIWIIENDGPAMPFPTPINVNARPESFAKSLSSLVSLKAGDELLYGMCRLMVEAKDTQQQFVFGREYVWALAAGRRLDLLRNLAAYSNAGADVKIAPYIISHAKGYIPKEIPKEAVQA